MPGQQPYDERRDALVQTFGNLTLLTTPLNSSVSDGPYDAKRAAYMTQALSRFNPYFQGVPVWNEEAILKRGEVLFEYAKAIWKHGA